MQYKIEYVQDEFISQGGHVQEIHFNNGDKFAGTHVRYYMEHAGCRGKTSAGQFYNFIKAVSDNDLGTILHHKQAKMSRRMLILTKKMCKNWYTMLDDIPGPCHNCLVE